MLEVDQRGTISTGFLHTGPCKYTMLPCRSDWRSAGAHGPLTLRRRPSYLGRGEGHCRICKSVRQTQGIRYAALKPRVAGSMVLRRPSVASRASLLLPQHQRESRQTTLHRKWDRTSMWEQDMQSFRPHNTVALHWQRGSAQSTFARVGELIALTSRAVNISRTFIRRSNISFGKECNTTRVEPYRECTTQRESQQNDPQRGAQAVTLGCLRVYLGL